MDVGFINIIFNAKTTTLLFVIPNLNSRLQDKPGTKEHPRLAVAGSKTPQAATTLVQLQKTNAPLAAVHSQVIYATRCEAHGR